MLQFIFLHFKAACTNWWVVLRNPRLMRKKSSNTSTRPSSDWTKSKPAKFHFGSFLKFADLIRRSWILWFCSTLNFDQIFSSIQLQKSQLRQISTLLDMKYKSMQKYSISIIPGRFIGVCVFFSKELMCRKIKVNTRNRAEPTFQCGEMGSSLNQLWINR